MLCFVTVGTTKFDDLLLTIAGEELLEALAEKGYNQLVIQCGASCFDEKKLAHKDMSIKTYKYKPSIGDDIQQADLVISHAGAGSCLEIMYARKPCIVVVNDRLMGNHQSELADQLETMHHIVQATPRTLISVIKGFSKESLVPYEKGKPERFSEYLTKVLGLQ